MSAFRGYGYRYDPGYYHDFRRYHGYRTWRPTAGEASEEAPPDKSTTGSDVVVNKSVLLIEEPQFTLNTARHLRTAIRREAATVVLVEVDDLIFDKLSRPSQIRS